MKRKIIYSSFSSSFFLSPGVPPLSSMSVRGTCRGETERCTGRGSPPWRGPGLRVSLTIFHLLWFTITLFKINYIHMHEIFQVLPLFWKSCLHGRWKGIYHSYYSLHAATTLSLFQPAVMLLLSCSLVVISPQFLLNCRFKEMFVLSVMQYRYLKFDYKLETKCKVKIFQNVFSAI